jgi:hypothetical protein
METKIDNTPNLRVVSETLGISYIATSQMYNFGAVHEEEIEKDLSKGLLMEWLTFINLYTDSYSNNFTEEIIKLFFDRLSDSMVIYLAPDELKKMEFDMSYSGKIILININDSGKESSRNTIRLTLNQYKNFIKTDEKLD